MGASATERPAAKPPREGGVPTVPALPRTLQGKKYGGFGRAIIPRSTFRPDGKVASGWSKWPHVMP
jgi:hypothetical protein